MTVPQLKRSFLLGVLAGKFGKTCKQKECADPFIAASKALCGFALALLALAVLILSFSVSRSVSFSLLALPSLLLHRRLGVYSFKSSSSGCKHTATYNEIRLVSPITSGKTSTGRGKVRQRGRSRRCQRQGIRRTFLLYRL